MGVRRLGRIATAARKERDEGVVSTPSASSGAASISVSVEETEAPRPLLEIEAPAWIAAMWRETKTLIRRVAGSALPAGACLDALLAEAAGGGWLSGEDPSAAIDRAGSTDVEAPGGDLHESASAGPAVGQLHGPASAGPPIERPAHDYGTRSGQVAARRSDEASPIGPGHQGPEDDRSAAEAGALDRELRSLATARQRGEARLAAELAACRRWESYRSRGYESIESYALDRHGLSARRMYYLLALHRDLAVLPALGRAFLSGRVTLRQALLIAKVASPATIMAWVRRAEAVTLRRLEDEIEFWTHLREVRHEVWRLLRGRPLPDGIALVPGHAPRLHACAPPDPSSQGSDSPAADRDGRLDGAGFDRATSARPIDAASFIRALEADEDRIPLPQRTCRIRIRVDLEVVRRWEEMVASLRRKVRSDLTEWEVLALAMREFWSVWDDEEARRKRWQSPTLERDGWRCTAPGCRSVGSGRLHEHHIEFRSAGGADKDPGNLTALCPGHHLGLLHRGLIRCTGRAPDGLMWEMGLEDGKEPFLVYVGERLTGKPRTGGMQLAREGAVSGHP
jgi:hypothetical protein